MNKTVYRFLKKIIKSIEENKRNKIRLFLEKDLSDKEIDNYNLNSGKIYSENEIKFMILNKYKDLFIEKEYKYYYNLLSLKKLLKK